MKEELIDNDIVRQLENNGLKKGDKEQQIKLLLTHTYMAIKMYREMSQEDRILATQWHKKFRRSYSLIKFLKERKTRRTKKSFPPVPPILNKKDEKKAQKTSLSTTRATSSKMEERQKAFWTECEQYIGKYERQMVQKFFYYWAEEVNGTGMMLWETKKSWNTKFRLAAWSRRSFEVNDQAANIRLQKAKNGATKPAADSAEQRAAAAEREEADARREAELAESRKNSISLEEYAKTHPDSQLARQFCKKGGGT